MWKKIMVALGTLFVLLFVNYAAMYASIMYATGGTVKTIFDGDDINKGDIVTYGKFSGHGLEWKVLKAENGQLTMITDKIVNNISGYGTAGLDAYMSGFPLIQTEDEKEMMITSPRILTKQEVFGGEDGEYTNPNSSAYFKSNADRAASPSSDPFDGPRQSYWATYTDTSKSENGVFNVTGAGDIYVYVDSKAKNYGIRPVIVTGYRFASIKKKAAVTNDQDSIVVREGEDNAKKDTEFADVKGYGMGEVQFSMTGDAAFSLEKSAEDDHLYTVKANTDLKAGTYEQSITVKDEKGEIKVLKLTIKVTKAYPEQQTLVFTPEASLTPDANVGDTLGTAALDGLSDAAAIKEKFQVDDVVFSIENASNANLRMEEASGILTFVTALDPGKHTFDVLVKLKEAGIVTKTYRLEACSISVDMDLVPEFTGVTEPLIYLGEWNHKQYTKKDMQIGALSVKDVKEADVTAYEILPGEQGALFRLSEKNKVINTADLHAGDYKIKLKITAKGIEKEGTAAFTIKKATPSIQFKNEAVTKKSIAEAQTNWTEEVEADTTGLKITYSVSGGNIALITIDPDSGAITYKGNGAFGKVTIRATIDDDPNSGYDDYEPAYAEKELNIYQEVDGTLTPDPASSDPRVPTFTANDTNIKTGGTIATVTGILGTPDEITGTKTTYAYTMKDGGNSSFFEIDSTTGIIKSKADLAVGNYTFTIVVSDRWSTKELPVTVNVGVAQAEVLKFYESSASTKAITSLTVKLTDQGVIVNARVLGSTNTKPVKYTIKDNSANVITVDQTTGAVTINGVGTVTILAEKEGAAGQAKAQAELTFTVEAGEQQFIYTDEAGNELPKSNDLYAALTETYTPDQTFQLYTGGSPVGAKVTYALKNDTASLKDVIAVDGDSGRVTILNASKADQMGKVIVVATSHDPSGSYEDVSIELPININKGERAVSFADNPIYVTSGSGSVTPVIMVDGRIDTEGTALIEIDAGEDSAIAWTNDNQTIQYEYQQEEAKDIKLIVTKPANRNYKAAQGTGTLHIMGADENVLTITSPGKIMYGDHFTIRSTQDDSSSSNVQYAFTVSDPAYISEPSVTGNKAEFDALKFSGQTNLTITVTRTADGEVPLSKTVTVKVLPKPVEIKLNDQMKQRGEENPELTYQDFKNQLVTWNGILDVIQPQDLKIRTTADSASKAGSYPITGDGGHLNQAYPNYSFTFKEGALTVIEDVIENDWYHMELEDGKQTPYEGGWTNQNVRIISDHDEYVQLSKDQATWKPNSLTIDQEGKQEQSFWMKKASGAISGEKKETIQIDQTAPTIKNITAKDSNNALQDLINQLSGGIFFKPGTTFEISTSDENGELETSGTASIQYTLYRKTDDSYGPALQSDTVAVADETASFDIDEASGTYQLCMIVQDTAGNAAAKTCHEIEIRKLDVDLDGDGLPEFNDPDQDGCADFNILYTDNNGDQRILNVDANRDGIPEMNIDTNGDGEPDINVDTDMDGRPDLNLIMFTKDMWKPTQCVLQHGEQYASVMEITPLINVDTDHDFIPNINIDTDGDMKADFCISLDGHTPFLNIGIIHKPWSPNKDYLYQGFAYDTSTECEPLTNIDSDKDLRPDINIDLDGNGKPDLNIDVDGDGIPDTNIDSTGDGIPDINIDHEGDGIPDENIVAIKEWKPNKNVDAVIPYDTMEIEGKKELEDNGITVEKPDGPFLPNFAIKVKDITDQEKEAITKDANELLNDQEVKAVYDVKLLKDNIEIQPNGKIRVKVPMPQGVKNPRVLIKNSDGEYVEVAVNYKDGYLVYETDQLGKISIIGDIEEEPKTPTPTPSKPKDPASPQKQPSTSVQGTYIQGQDQGIGGALTGDQTNAADFMKLCLSASVIFLLMRLRRTAFRK